MSRSIPNVGNTIKMINVRFTLHFQAGSKKEVKGGIQDKEKKNEHKIEEKD